MSAPRVEPNTHSAPLSKESALRKLVLPPQNDTALLSSSPSSFPSSLKELSPSDLIASLQYIGRNETPSPLTLLYTNSSLRKQAEKNLKTPLTEEAFLKFLSTRKNEEIVQALFNLKSPFVMAACVKIDSALRSEETSRTRELLARSKIPEEGKFSTVALLKFLDLPQREREQYETLLNKTAFRESLLPLLRSLPNLKMGENIGLFCKGILASQPLWNTERFSIAMKSFHETSPQFLKQVRSLGEFFSFSNAILQTQQDTPQSNLKENSKILALKLESLRKTYQLKSLSIEEGMKCLTSPELLHSLLSPETLNVISVLKKSSPENFSFTSLEDIQNRFLIKIINPLEELKLRSSSSMSEAFVTVKNFLQLFPVSLNTQIDLTPLSKSHLTLQEMEEKSKNSNYQTTLKDTLSILPDWWKKTLSIEKAILLDSIQENAQQFIQLNKLFLPRSGNIPTFDLRFANDQIALLSALQQYPNITLERRLTEEGKRFQLTPTPQGKETQDFSQGDLSDALQKISSSEGQSLLLSLSLDWNSPQLSLSSLLELLSSSHSQERSVLLESKNAFQLSSLFEQLAGSKDQLVRNFDSLLSQFEGLLQKETFLRTHAEELKSLLHSNDSPFLSPHLLGALGSDPSFTSPELFMETVRLARNSYQIPTHEIFPALRGLKMSKELNEKLLTHSDEFSQFLKKLQPDLTLSDTSRAVAFRSFIQMLDARSR